jgi:acyl carrier protein
VTKSHFVRELELSLQADPGAFTDATVLKTLSGWDSLGRMNVVLIFDELKVSLPTGALDRAETVGDLVKLAGIQGE